MKRFHRRGAVLSAFGNTIVPKYWENDKWRENEVVPCAFPERITGSDALRMRRLLRA